MKPKVLIIILVVIVALFIAGMVFNARSAGSKPTLPTLSAMIRNSMGRLAADQALKPADVSSTSGSPGCSNLLDENGQATVANNGFCMFVVNAKEKAVRSMSLQLNQGLSGRFTTINHNPEIELSINLNQCKQVQIMEDGGTLIVACGGGTTPCVFKVTQCP